MPIFRMLGSSGSQASPVVPEAVQAAAISSADAKQFGLENFGNTCYINAILQALYFCPPFRELVISMPDSSCPSELTADLKSLTTTTKPISRVAPKRRDSSALDSPDHANGNGEPSMPVSPPSLFSALRSLFIYIAQNPQDKGKVSPTAFVQKVKAENEAFRNTNHQDAHEAFNFILNKVVEDLEAEEKSLSQSKASANSNGPLALARSRKNLVHDLFEGVLTSETRCLTCETVSSRDESFLDLSIDIEPHSSVTACLRQFSASEMLCQRNKFSCDSCSGLQEAEKRMKVKKLPNVLALHLKRFKYQEEAQKFIKLSYRVAFPLELRLFNTTDEAENADRLYELFAIVVHIGGGPHHGHYTTIIRSQGAWFLYDDDNVETIKETDIPKYFGESSVGAGYVLFYQAVDMDYPGVGLPQPKSKSPSINQQTHHTEDVVETGNPAKKDDTYDIPPLDPSLATTTTPRAVTEPSPTKLSPESPSPLRSLGPVGPNTPGDKESFAARLRHYKSEKNIPVKLDPPSDQAPLLPLPLPTRRPKTGDAATSLDKESRRKSWFTRGKSINKRSKEPPTSFPTLSVEDANETNSRHARSRTLSNFSDSVSDNASTQRPSTSHVNGGSSSPKDARPPGLYQEASIPAPDVDPPLSPSPEATRAEHPVAAPNMISSKPRTASPAPLTQPTSPFHPPAMPQLPISPHIPPPPAASATSPTILSTDTVTSPIKKAVRKMSLSAMPIKFGGLGRRDKER